MSLNGHAGEIIPSSKFSLRPSSSFIYVMRLSKQDSGSQRLALGRRAKTSGRVDVMLVGGLINRTYHLIDYNEGKITNSLKGSSGVEHSNIVVDRVANHPLKYTNVPYLTVNWCVPVR